jgi:hypothetical protein
MKCSNPDCRLPFDHREGRLIRFCKPPLDSQPAAQEHRVEHFWLCGSCANTHVFEYQRGAGMKIVPRARKLRERAVLSSVTAA